MKKIVLSALAVVTIGVTAQAQTDIKFGVKAGLNLATYGADGSDVGTRTSMHVGAIAEFKLSENISLQPEVIYSMQGATADIYYADAGITVDTTDKLDYINVPVMFKYFVIEGLSLEAGPQVGFLLSAKTKGEYGGESEEIDSKDSYKSIDFGLNGGVGYELPIGVFFQARYYTGLANIFDNDAIDGAADAEVTNQVIQFSVGYKF